MGRNRGSEATITASYATGNVNGNDHSIVGGLVGENDGVITASYATGMVTSMGDEAGGLVGKNEGTITASYATGMVASTGNEAGGLVGENENEGVITASYATGMVASTGNEVGGLVGKNDGTITASYFDTDTSGFTEGTGAKSTSEQPRRPTELTPIFMLDGTSMSTAMEHRPPVLPEAWMTAAWQAIPRRTIPGISA